MAAEMLEKILEAENSAKEKLAKANKEADELLAQAESKAKEMLLNAKKTAETEGDKTLKECNDAAKALIDKKISEAQTECARLKESSSKKSKECADIVIKKIFA